MTTTVLDGIRSSPKGNLIYDKYWHDDGRVEEVVEYCSSPPAIAEDLLVAAFTKISLSTHRYGNRAEESRHSNEEQRSSPRAEDQTEHTCTKSPCSSPSQPGETRHNVDRALDQVEQEWEDLAKERAKERGRQLEEHTRWIQEQAEQNMALRNQQRELKQRAVFQMMRQTQKEMEEKRERRLIQQQESHRLHLKRLDDKMKAAVQQREAEEMEKRKREKERQDFLRNVQRIQSRVDEGAQRILQSLDTCPHKQHLPEGVGKIGEQVQALCAKAGTIVTEAKTAVSFTELEKTIQRVVEKLMQIQEYSIKMIAEAERKFREDAAKKEKEQQKLEQEKLKAAQAAKAEQSQPLPQPQPQTQKTQPSKVALETSISPEALQEYNSLEEKHRALEESCKGLNKTTDKDLKKYRFELQKTVNTTLNSVSVQSGGHLLDKLKRLKDLLSGREVDQAGRRVVATRPAGIAFCKNLAAKKLVKQGDEQVSSNHESAFAFAAIAVALWQEIPDIGDMFLYHFYQNCPFLVPYHISKKENQSLEDYYKSLGYIYDGEGQIEKQDKYLRRMTGFSRLYAAIIATPPLRGQAHPHGVERGWMFLARVMNLEPQPDITATIIYDFLDVCGQALAEAYGKQFFKLLQTMYKEYFTKIEAVTPQGSGGPVTRLKGFLEDCLKRQRVPAPKGFLSSDFWRS